MSADRQRIVFGAIVMAGVAIVLWSQRPKPTPDQAAAHAKTELREAEAAKAETVYVSVRDSAIAARVPLRKLRDSVITHPSDTVTVLRYVAKVDTLLHQDSTALARADTTIQKLHVVIASKDTELVLARMPGPRLHYTVAALYDPIRGEPSGSADATFRLVRGLALVGRVDQRAAIGERPDLKVGLSLTF